MFNHTFFEEPEDLSGKSAWVGHIPFAIWAVDFFKPGCVVELGTHCGDSYFAFCQSARKFSKKTKLFAVDTWEGDKHAGFYESTVFDRVNRINESKYAGFSTLLRKTFDQALADFSDGSVDLLHIDGLHTYEAVKHDFISWAPKLSDTSVVFFHDTMVQRDDFGVYRFWEEIRKEYPSINFSHSSGLGILVTGEREHPKIKQFCQFVAFRESRNLFVDYFRKLGHLCEVRQKELVLDKVIQYSEHLEKDISAYREYQTRLEKDISELREYQKKLETANHQLAETNEKTLCRLKDTEGQLAWHKEELSRICATKIWRYTAFLRKIRRVFSSDYPKSVDIYFRKGPAGRLVFRLKTYYDQLKAKLEDMTFSSANLANINHMARKRQMCIEQQRNVDPDLSGVLIDITAVLYNNGHWLEKFMSSLENQNFPLKNINLFFVDNGSTDDSLKLLIGVKEKYSRQFRSFHIIENQNTGYGAGHHKAMQLGDSRYVLVSNIDLEFEKNAIVRVVEKALCDDNSAACWEFRQKPYEHPKYYDPVTHEVSWSSHACILMRRTAYEDIEGYDKRIFMYGEDVELSYRFREKGYCLRYVPNAVVYHYTYARPNEVKPAQFSGSIIANALIRFRYGGMWDKLSVLPLQFFLICRGGGFRGSRMLALKSQFEIMRLMPFFWNRRMKNDSFPFYGFDYEKKRHGSFYEVGPLLEKTPLVSVVTRTYKGRDALLKECMASVINQTYPAIEHIVVEDGGDSLEYLIDEMQTRYPAHRIIHHAVPKKGRAYAGNQGMKMAKGRYLLFLDDDDLLFSDHVEILAGTLLADDGIDAAYSLAWEVETAFCPDGGYWEHDHKTNPIFFQEFDRDLLMHHNYIPIQSMLFKRELYKKHGGFDLEMDFLEDWNLWSRYALNAAFKFVPKTTSMFRTPHDVKIRMRRKKQLDQAYPGAVARLRKIAGKPGCIDEKEGG